MMNCAKRTSNEPTGVEVKQGQGKVRRLPSSNFHRLPASIDSLTSHILNIGSGSSLQSLWWLRRWHSLLAKSSTLFRLRSGTETGGRQPNQDKLRLTAPSPSNIEIERHTLGNARRKHSEAESWDERVQIASQYALRQGPARPRKSGR